jgi:hypothetical protein
MKEKRKSSWVSSPHRGMLIKKIQSNHTYSKLPNQKPIEK